jgi:hypothetical protein
MKKTQVALAALALVASTAAMADVTVGGYVDAGIQNTTGNGTVLSGGNLDINNIRFAASEEIDGGLKAGAFALVRFESATGGLTRPGGTDGSNNGTFFEIAHANLSSASLGTVEIGRTVDSYWGNGVAGFDVTGGSNLGSAVASTLNLQTSKVFVDNSIHYVSPNLSGLTLAATYVVNDSSTGATIANAMKGDKSATANYSINGVRLGAGYMKSNLTKGYFFAAGYDFGFANVNAIYQDATDANSYGVNAAVPLVGALSATAGYYTDAGNTFLKGKGSSTNLGLIYALSKRTRLFANYQHTTDALTTNIGLSNPSSSGVVGTTMTAGIGHSF